MSLLVPLSMCAFRRVEESLACSCADPFPLLRFRARVNFGAPKSVGCVYGHNAHVHELVEVNMASMDKELFLLIPRCRQRNQLNRMRLMLLAHKSRHHRYTGFTTSEKKERIRVFFHYIDQEFLLLDGEFYTRLITRPRHCHRVLHVIQDARGIPGESHP